jgi:alkylation response protein AidB-like acyl-CoA dehydrogenase
MEFSLPPAVVHLRDEVRGLLAEHGTPERIAECHRSGTFHIPEVNNALAERGILERAVPGMGKSDDPLEMWVLFNEFEKAGVPSDALSISMMIAGVIVRVGTEEQKARILPSIIEGRSYVCMGYSEPDSGSDVAAAKTRAVRDGDQWVINGAKMWTTMAHVADWLILLTRTDPDVPKHRGLTMFILPMDTPGITVEPVYTMGTERTNATFYDDVRVGDEAVLGEVNGGWHTMTVALSLERGVMGGTSPGVPLLRHFREWAVDSGAIDDPLVRERMARVAIDNEVATLLTQRSAWIAASGGQPSLEGSMTKIFATETYQKASRWFFEAAAPHGLLQFDQAGAAGAGWIEYDARHSPVVTIYGGTSEINRNNIAERHLGLPKAR